MKLTQIDKTVWEGLMPEREIGGIDLGHVAKGAHHEGAAHHLKGAGTRAASAAAAGGGGSPRAETVAK